MPKRSGSKRRKPQQRRAQPRPRTPARKTSARKVVVVIVILAVVLALGLAAGLLGTTSSTNQLTAPTTSSTTTSLPASPGSSTPVTQPVPAGVKVSETAVLQKLIRLGIAARAWFTDHKNFTGFVPGKVIPEFASTLVGPDVSSVNGGGQVTVSVRVAPKAVTYAAMGKTTCYYDTVISAAKPAQQVVLHATTCHATTTP